jgi:hypothetical protein
MVQLTPILFLLVLLKAVRVAILASVVGVRLQVMAAAMEAIQLLQAQGVAARVAILVLEVLVAN